MSLLPNTRRLRTFVAAPATGTVGKGTWTQHMAGFQIRLPLRNDGWGDVKESDITVEISEWEMKVYSKKKGDPGGLLKGLCGKDEFHADMKPSLCWWCIEREKLPIEKRPSGGYANQENGPPKEEVVPVLTIDLCKAKHNAWPGLWLVGPNHRHKKSFFPWNENQKPEGDMAREDNIKLITIKPGRKDSDEDDDYVTCREHIALDFSTGQSFRQAYMRIHFDKGGLDKALEKCPWSRLFGLDVSESHLRLFIRGDENSPILMGKLGGEVEPDKTHWSVDKVMMANDPTKPNVREPSPVLTITLVKKKEFEGNWDEILISTDQMSERNTAPRLEDLNKADNKIRDKSPDRTEWSPEMRADEMKKKGDDRFKAQDFRDAAVYYSRALKHTPRNEKILSNRAACYMKIRKFESAFEDAKLACQLTPEWPKAYYRKGCALRALNRFDQALAAFEDGRALDPDNPDWDKEAEKTEELWEAFNEKGQKVRADINRAKVTTKMNETVTAMEQQAMVLAAEAAVREGKSPQEAGKLAAEAAKNANKLGQEQYKHKLAMVEDTVDPEEHVPYTIVNEDGSIHYKAYLHQQGASYFEGLTKMIHTEESAAQPWIEIEHPKKLRWTQQAATLKIQVPIPESIKNAAKEVDIIVTKTDIRIGTRGNADPLVEGKFCRPVNPDGESYSWYVDTGHNTIFITLDKDAGELWQTGSYLTMIWNKLFEDDTELAAGLFECDMTDLPEQLLEKYKNDTTRQNKHSEWDRRRREKMTEDETEEEVGRNWNEEFAKHEIPMRMDTAENDPKPYDRVKGGQTPSDSPFYPKPHNTL